MSAAKTPLLDQYEALQAKLAELRTGEREEARRRDGLATEDAHVREALRDAQASHLANGTQPGKDVAALKARAEQITAELADDAPVDTARRAVAIKTAQLAEFVTANIDAILAEVEPAARDAQQALVKWLQDFDTLGRKWLEPYSLVSKLLGLANHRNPQELSAWDPRSGSLRSAVRDQLAMGVPVPLPRPLTAPPTVVPEHDPDPAVREPARDKLRRAA